MNVSGSKYDIIILGGGPSGSAAAIAAGRKGAKVLLIERQNCLGGMWTSGFVNPLFDSANKKGIMKELVDDLKAKNVWGGFWKISFVYEYMKSLLEEKCLDAGVTLLYDTDYTGVLAKDGKVKGVWASNIEGRKFYEADVFIDCTGDAQVAVDAGADFFVGGEDEKDCQSMTLMFLVGGIPEKYSSGLMIYDVLKKAFDRENKGHSPVFNMPYLITVPNSDFAVMQYTHMRGFSPVSATDRTQATIEGRRQAIEAFEALKNYDEDFRDLYIIGSAPMLGIRESRRIDGEYYLTEDDAVNGASFEDEVTTASFGIDIHPAKSDVQDCRHVEAYGIPYRCMIPKKLTNLLVAGKTISGSHIAMASYRVTGNCCAMGEAAGIAAAYSVKNGCGIREVPIKDLL